jgi:transcriptional regulator with XRE-family HTH domain
VGKASITNLLPHGRARAWASSLGWEVRRRRLAARLSQGELSAPLTRAYVSQVERGETIPSLPALIVLAEKLGTSADEVLRAVNRTLNSEYPARHENHRTKKPGT